MPDDAHDLTSHLLEKTPAARFDLEKVKAHSWFLVDYEQSASEGTSSSTGGVRPGSTKGTV